MCLMAPGWDVIGFGFICLTASKCYESTFYCLCGGGVCAVFYTLKPIASSNACFEMLFYRALYGEICLVSCHKENVFSSVSAFG